MKEHPHVAVRDMLVFLGLSILPIASFWLAKYPNTEFYTVLLTLSLIVLFGIQLSHKSLKFFNYDTNLDWKSLLIAFGGAAATLLISGMLASAAGAKSALNVPMQKLSLEYGQVSLPPLWSDALYQIVLVAPSEEAAKLAVMLILLLWLERKVGEKPAILISVVASVGGWAVLHTFQNPDYQGSNMVLMVSAAFIDGLIFIVTLYYTKSWLVPVLSHFGFNFWRICVEYGVFNNLSFSCLHQIPTLIPILLRYPL